MSHDLDISPEHENNSVNAKITISVSTALDQSIDNKSAVKPDSIIADTLLMLTIIITVVAQVLEALVSKGTHGIQ